MHKRNLLIGSFAIVSACFCAAYNLASASQSIAGATTWTVWTKNSQPVWEGWFMAGDPAVIRNENSYDMFYTGFLPEPDRAVLGHAVSLDGVNWDWATPVDSENPVSLALDGVDATWDHNLETAHVHKIGGEWFLYYCGYPATAEPVPPAELGLARSTDGITFTRHANAPIMARTPGWFDNDAIFSPSIVTWNNEFYMVYAGHCWTDCAEVGPGLRLLGATSTDGITWNKRSTPVLEAADLPESLQALSVGEPALKLGPDGWFYLFVTVFFGQNDLEEGVRIAVGRSDAPLGPWEFNPTAIVTATQTWEGTEVIAPDVIIDGDTAHIWYHGFVSDPEKFAVGHAESPWPLTIEKSVPTTSTWGLVAMTVLLVFAGAVITTHRERRRQACTR